MKLSALRLLAVGLVLFAATDARADSIQLNPDDGPLFAFVSLTPTFETRITPVGGSVAHMGSELLPVLIGKITGGVPFDAALAETAEAGSIVIPQSQFPTVPLDGKQVTVIGSMREGPPISLAHIFSPSPRFHSFEVQEAWFNASRLLADQIDDLFDAATGLFPTTGDIMQFVYENQGGAGATLQSIVRTPFFDSDMFFSCAGDSCEADGDLLPHSPEADTGRFYASVNFNTDPNVRTFDVRVTVVPLPPGAWAGLGLLFGLAGVRRIRRSRGRDRR